MGDSRRGRSRLGFAVRMTMCAGGVERKAVAAEKRTCPNIAKLELRKLKVALHGPRCAFSSVSVPSQASTKSRTSRVKVSFAVDLSNI